MADLQLSDAYTTAMTVSLVVASWAATNADQWYPHHNARHYTLLVEAGAQQELSAV